MGSKTDINTDLTALGPTREEQVLALAAQGYTDKQMAAKLGISRETVATYWRRILQRFHASSRTEVVATVLQQRADGLTEENQRLLYEIAERRRGEHEISKIANRLKSLIGSLRTGVLFEDDQRTILYCNESYAQMFDLPIKPEALVGMNSQDALRASKEAFVHADAALSRIDGLVAAKRPVTGEEIRLVNGRVMERDYVPIEGRDGIEGHLWHYRDVTQESQNAAARETYVALSDLVSSMVPQFIGASAEQLPGLITGLLREVGSTADADRSLVYLYDPATRDVTYGYEWAVSGKVSQIGTAIAPRTFEWLSESMSRGKTLMVGNVVMLPAEAATDRAELTRRGIEAILAVPIRRNHELIGWVTLEMTSRREWNEGTAKVLRTVAEVISAALGRSKPE